jgi:hypothetical protein
MSTAKKRLPRRIWWLVALLLLLVLIEVLFDPFSAAVNAVERLRIRSELRQARALWESASIKDYDLKVSGYTPLACIVTEEMIPVRDGQAPEKPATPSWQYCQVPRTVPDGLDRVKEALDWGGSLQVRFDEQYGYVSTFKYSCVSGRGLLSPIIADCGESFRIDGFTPLTSP